MNSKKIESLTQVASKMASDATNVRVSESGGVLWVGCDVFYGVHQPKRSSRPIGTIEMPMKYLKEEIKKWASEN